MGARKRYVERASGEENEGGRSVLMSVRCAEVAVFVL